METIRFAIIGCGYRGRELALLCAEHNLPLVAVSDVDLKQAKKLAKELRSLGLSVRAGSLEQILAFPEIEAVIIATPTDTHFECVQEAALAGKHILCEKPLAASVDECEVLELFCEEQGVRLAVGSQCRLWGVPAFAKTDLLPRLGQIHSIMMWRMVNTPEIALTGWRTDSGRNPMGQLMDHHIHNVDLLNWMFGEGKVEGAIASTGKHFNWSFPDQYHALLRYQASPEGKPALCSFVASEVSFANKWSLKVDGKYGTLKVPSITWRQDVLERYPMSIQYSDGKEEVFTPTLPTENPNVTQVRRFLHAMATGEPADTTAKDALNAVRVIDEIIRASERYVL